MFITIFLHIVTPTNLCTGDSEGVIIASEIDGGTRNKLPVVLPSSFLFQDEILVNKREYEKRKTAITELNHNIHELNVNNEHQLRVKEMEHKNRIKFIAAENSKEIEGEKSRWASLSVEKQELDDRFSDEMFRRDELHESQIASIDTKYKIKLNIEDVRQKQLTAEIEAIQTRWDQENMALGNRYH